MIEPERKSLTFKVDLGNVISVLGFVVTIGFIVFNSGKRDAKLDYVSETIGRNAASMSRVESKTDSLSSRISTLEWTSRMIQLGRDKQWEDMYRRIEAEEADTRRRRDGSAAVKKKDWPKDWNDMERIRQEGLVKDTPGPQP